MLADVLDVLRCPVCTGRLEHGDQALICPQRHTFDVARQGYVNLLAGVPSRTTADTGEMVCARDEFLIAGHYAPLAEALADAASAVTAQHTGDVVLDAGAGTGYYAATVLDRIPRGRGLALDASKFAARRAARAHPRLASAVWDAWRPWPLQDGSVTVLLNVFAPRNAAEFRRVLRPGGTALVVTPTPAHLAELVEPLNLLTVDEQKDDRLERSLADHLRLEHREQLTFPLALPATDVERLVRMGPSSWHVDGAALTERLDAMLAAVPAGMAASMDEPVRATASVNIARYHAR